MHTLISGPQAWQRWWNRLVGGIDQNAILTRVADEAAFTFNYMFMVAAAAGIAIVGLLQNSPAVIIGAMLISPLMGPIVANGFALTTVDLPLGKGSAATLTKGALAAVAFSALIVWLSPVRELTPEILARTRPNLFDLLVAALSGAAGGYAVIRGRGGAIVGVAIATALMPPLSVVGYGVATRQWQVAQGALLLFVTNMVAISIAVALIAEWYGFGRSSLRKGVARQAALALLLVAPISVPLFYSLKSIAWESLAASTIRRTLRAGAEALPDGTLGEMRIRFDASGTPLVDAIIVSTRPSPGIRVELEHALTAALGVPVQFRLSQVHATDAAAAPPTVVTADTHETLRLNALSALTAEMRRSLPVAVRALEVDEDERRAVLLPVTHPDFGLEAYRAMAEAMQRRYPGWTIQFVPPVLPLPAIPFAARSSVLDGEGIRVAETIAWALAAWQVDWITVTGHASAEGRSARRLASMRAESVAAFLARRGLRIDAGGQYPHVRQRDLERRAGVERLRSVEVGLKSPVTADQAR